jgi:4-aminobutyrate aminotransferase-like enzyme
VLRFVPPLVVTQHEIDEMITILDGILAEVEA